MCRLCTLFLSTVVLFAIAGCNDADNLDFEAEDVSSIQVVEWQGGDEVVRIEDRSFIDELVEALDTADTGTTSDLDMMLPEYRVEFQDEEEILIELGYCERVMNLGGVDGRYWNRSEQVMYEVERELPFD